MRKSGLLFSAVLLFLAFEPLSLAQSLQSPIVQLGSEYTDSELKDKKVTEVGSGILVDFTYEDNVYYRDRQFVLTNAHLTHGENPWVLVNGKRVQAKVIDLDAVEDLAILAIPRTGIESAYNYSTETGIVPHDNLGARLRCLSGNDQNPRCAEVEKDQRLKRIHFSTPARQDSEARARGVVFSPSWASTGSEEGTLPRGFRSWRHDPKFTWIGPEGVARHPELFTETRPFNTFDGHHFIIPALTSGGNSGSLVVDEELEYRFLGIPAQYSYFSHQVKVVGPELFGRMFEANRGKLGQDLSKPSEPRACPCWKIKNGYSYLDFGDGTIDTDFTRTTSGGQGSSAPPGGQGSSAPPGGQGTSAPPGAPCTPGQSSSPENTSMQDTRALSIAASEVLLGKSQGVDPEKVLEMYGISPYMSQNGKRVYGFEVRDKSGDFKTVLAPNAEGYAWVLREKKNDRYEIRPLFDPPNFLNLVDDKLQVRNHPASGKAYISADASRARSSERQTIRYVDINIGDPDLRRVPLEKPYSYHDSPDRVESEPSGEAVVSEAKAFHGNASLEAVGESLHLKWKMSSDQLDLTLDQLGRVNGNKNFLPVVKVRSKKGSEFYLDLRPLLYTDLSTTYPATEKIDWSQKKNGLKLFASQVGLRLTTIQDATGDGKPGDERVIQFNF